MKKLLAALICIISCLSIALGCGISAAAAVASLEGFGTYEDGIIPNGKHYTSYHNPVPEDIFPNPDFQMGLMYWTTCNGQKPADMAPLVKEGNNVFIQINAVEQYDGIESVRFREERVKPGDQLVTIYDWRGSEKHNIQVYITQFDVINGRLTSNFKTIKEAKNATDWNTSVALNKAPVSMPPNDGEIFLGLGAQAFQDTSCRTQIDNIRIGKYDPATGDVHDLDGNLVCNIGAAKKPANTESKPDKPQKEETTNNNTSTEDTTNTIGAVGESEITAADKVVIGVAIGVILVVLIAVAVVLIIVLKKKNK